MHIEYRWAEGRNDRLANLAAELVRQQVNIIVVGGSTPGSLAAKEATQITPIVFLIGTDPVKVGLVSSLSQPGTNLTGITILNVLLFTKCIELMNQLVPNASTIAVLVNPANAAQTATEVRDAETAAGNLGVAIRILKASNPDEIEAVFRRLADEPIGALVVSGEYFFLSQRHRLASLAAQHKIPTVYAYREYVDAGGLMSYGTDNFDAHRKVGLSTGRILKGAKASDLPVQQVTKVEMLINLRAASELGLTVPINLLARADLILE